MAGIRGSLTEKLIEMLTLKGDELILDLATGTGRVARPLSKHIKGGRIVGVDQALAMLDVGHQHEDPIAHYVQSAGEADKLPFKTNTFDRAFVSFSLHHFGNPSGVVSTIAPMPTYEPDSAEFRDARSSGVMNVVWPVSPTASVIPSIAP